MSLAGSYSFPPENGVGTESTSISTSQVGIFQGSVAAYEALPNHSGTYDGFIETDASCDASFTVIALNDNTTNSSPSDIQVVDSLSGSVFSTSGMAATLINGNLQVTPTRTGTQSVSSNTIRSAAGIYSTSNDGPINLTVSSGDMLSIGYGASITSDVNPNGPVPQSANGNFDAMLGYIAPPGWGLYIENADGTHSVPLHEFPAAIPEASTTVSFSLLFALGLGGVVLARKKSAAA